MKKWYNKRKKKVKENVKAQGSATLDTGLTVYDLNKQVLSQQEPMSAQDIEDKKELIEQVKSLAYSLLLCHELRYYTFFVNDENAENTRAFEVIDCLQSLGEIYYIEFQEEQNAVEIWVKTTQDGEMHCFYYFDYDAGVIKYRG